MKIGVISTLSHNIGDDFVRVGITRLLDELAGRTNVRYVVINKHAPLSVYPPFHPLHWIGRAAAALPRGGRRLERTMEGAWHNWRRSRLGDCDVIVQSGAPVIFEGCANAEWASALWDHVVGPAASRAVILNLAAGSCYAWQQPPARVGDPADAAFLLRIASYCRLTTVRDKLAEGLLTELGVCSPRLPCTAFLSAGELVSSGTESSPIYVNYMEGGGHYAFGQPISSERWRRTLAELMERLARRHEVRVLCHTPGEKDLARRAFPGYPVVLPSSVEEYYQVIREAKFGLFNRLHAAVALAGIGAPAMGIGTDTRMLMLEEIGIPHRFVGDANAEEMESAAEGLMRRRREEGARFLELRRDVRSRYLALLRPLLEPTRSE